MYDFSATKPRVPLDTERQAANLNNIADVIR